MVLKNWLGGFRIDFWVQLMQRDAGQLVQGLAVLRDGHTGLAHAPDHVLVYAGQAFQRTDAACDVYCFLNTGFARHIATKEQFGETYTNGVQCASFFCALIRYRRYCTI
jgi:hypothetical protein